MKKNKSAAKKLIPEFKNEDDEREFWNNHSILDFPDRFIEADLDLTNLKPSNVSVTVRLPQMMVEDLKRLANKDDVPYQSLMKIYLAEKIQEKLKSSFSGK